MKEATEVIRQACKVNQTELDDFTLAPLLEVGEESVPITEFLKPEQRKLSFPLWTVWLSFGFVYYGIILFVSRVFSEGDDDDDEITCDFSYQDIFISATSEVVGVFVAGSVIDRSPFFPSSHLTVHRSPSFPQPFSAHCSSDMVANTHNQLAMVSVRFAFSSWD
jgi:hypothetical protein